MFRTRGSMCGRYGLYREPRALVARLRARFAANAVFVPRYNIAPTAAVLAIPNTLERNVLALRWGLVPRFRERTPARRSTFNARIETLATSPLYGPVLPTQRCIVLADGYYEWPQRPDGRTDPIWIFRADGATIAFAGLWDADSVTIVTQPANETIARLHDRMPVTLEPDDADAWLTPQPLDAPSALALLTPSDPAIWEHHRVERTVGNARAEGPELIAPLGRESREHAQLALFTDND